MSPVVPHFPRFPNFRGHNSEKMRNQTGITERLQTGTDEVVFGNVTNTESRGDVVSDAASTGWGYVCISQERQG